MPCAQFFDDRKCFSSSQSRRANGFLEIAGFPRQRIERFALDLGKSRDVVVKTGNRYAGILVMQFGKQFAQDGDWIGHRATENSRMQILRGSGDLNLVVIEST